MPDPSYEPPSALAAAQAAVVAAESVSESLRVSELRYRRLFEAARDGILILDFDSGRITDANPFMSELLGYSLAELLGKELWEIGLLQDKQSGLEAFQQLKRDGYIRYEDLPLVNHNGHKREVEFVCNIYNENARNVIQCNIRDVTERKRTESALATLATKNKRIVETLQCSMLQAPVSENFNRIEVETRYQAAMDDAAVGGDFFDAFSLNDGKTALVVGDVSGKGLIAAGRTAEVKYALRAFLYEHSSPEAALARLNNFICDTHRFDEANSETFVVVSLAVVHGESGIATFALAGAESPIILRPGRPTELIALNGLALGIQPNIVYASKSISLVPGDSVLLVTDGITEARQGDNFLDIEGVVALAESAGSDCSLKELIRVIYEGANDFSHGDLRDDICMLLARRY